MGRRRPVQVRRLDRASLRSPVRVENLPIESMAQRALSFGILSSYPPTPCGLATFSAALASGLSEHESAVGVVQVLDAGAPKSCGAPVVGHLSNGSPRSVQACSEMLNHYDVALVQHEYGLYGGADGDELLEILGALQVPSIVIAHTVLTHPTAHQRSVLTEVVALADRVVVMTEAAQTRLCGGFDVDASKVTTIAHGAAVPRARVVAERSAPPVILTWGLIGPGKGIERVIDAMRTLHDLPMRPRYLVAGQTHPKVLAAHGESYRQDRVAQAEGYGISSSVVFDADYRDVESLTTLIQASAVVALPYDSKDQVTSGVLVDAIAAGRPVVATAFPHAIELLSSGAGLVVDHDDPDAMAVALRTVLTEPQIAAAMAAEAARLAPGLGWSVVADEYRHVADRLLSKRLSLV